MTSHSPARGKKPYKSWLKDGVNGGPSSMDILIGWLSDRANYAKWRGDDCSERTPKKLLLEEIIERLRQVGIYHRLPKDVASKISTLQSNYRTAREWTDTEGKKLRQAGAKEEVIREEILKRFPYWDALHDSFGSPRTSSAWPMSISSIMDREQDDDSSNYSSYPDEDDASPPKRRRRLSDSELAYRQSGKETIAVTTMTTTRSSTNDNCRSGGSSNNSNFHNDSDCSHNSNTRRSDSSTNLVSSEQVARNASTVLVPPRVPPFLSYGQVQEKRETVLAESLIQVTREKEAGRMKRSQNMLDFLREKRVEREQLIIEREKTRRIRAKAELVKNLTDAGFTKEEIAEQLKTI